MAAVEGLRYIAGQIVWLRKTRYGNAVLLTDDDIHVWRADTALLTEQRLASCRQLMSEQERVRNLRYRFERDRQRDCLTRALVRTVLSQYADVAPRHWLFERGEHGKPELANAAVTLRFNVSHTSRYVVCAVSRQQDIGVDIECTERRNDVRAIASHYFSAQEVSALQALPAEQQTDRFFDYWTLKEAYMKARGEGISLGLGNFSFQLAEAADIGISFADKLRDQPALWRFWLFRPAADHRLALALRLQHSGQRPTVTQFDANELISTH